MTHRGRGSSFVVSGGFRKGSARTTQWFGSAQPTLKALAGLTFAEDQTLVAAGLAKLPFTVTRVVGSIYIGNDQVAALERPFGALGFAVVSDQAEGIGGASLPDPIGDMSSDLWFVYRSFGEIGGPVVGNPFSEFKFDSRGQRKVEDGSTIVIMVSNGAAAAHILNYVLFFRMLVKLS